LNGGEDGFVTKFNFNGSNIDFSTFLGGGGDDIGTAVAVDNQNRAYITGVTRSGNFPTQNSIQSNNAGGADAYVTRFESSGANLEFSTYFGGSADDTSSGITVDGDGNFYFTGYTLSGNFPTMNAFQGNNAGASDVFIAWIAPDAMPFDDCNNNGVPDSLDIVNGTSQDCNNNWIPDECDIASGNSGDCNNNGRPDECDIGGGMSNDCNNNGIPDECELMGNDCNNNGIPDDCELAGNDCNNNGVPDDCDIAAGAPDCNNNGVLDECELQGNDCNNNGILDECEDLINPTPINSTASINIIPNHDHSSEPVCDNFAAAISADGRFIAFESRAENLVPDDNNDAGDVFVYDAQTGNLERVSVSSSGQEANGRSTSPSISEDGQLVAFVTGANNLVPNDSNGVTDVFVHNRQTGVTVRASVSSTGEEANRGTGRQTAMISGDGRYVKFHSSATNLVPNDSTLNEEMFVRDLQNGVTVRPVAFNSNTFEITTSISQTGRFMTFSVPDQPELDSLDINFDWDVYIHDRDPDENGIFDEGNGITELISVSDSGQIGNNSSFSQPYASADGRYVVFASQATNFVPNDSNGFQSDLFVHDRLTGMKEIVSVSTAGQQANAHTFGSLGKYMSDDGRFVTFATTADNLVSGDTNGEADIFLHDRHLGTTQRISLSSGGPQANGGSSGPAINTNGQYVAFSSDADNLVPGDVDNVANVFLVDIDIINSISEQETVSRRSESFRLFQNYPNPFNPSTTIEFSLPRSGEVSLKIFNALGQEVTELVHQRLSAGYFKVQWNAATLPSGTYFYRLKVGNYSETRRLILFK
ncbi:MAG: T9SS type A sorting domain-containing protein, partial [candidate division Zixibacteria bacterium]|nr:T9SS type A sorting domain-containing protein [Gammaproteobacteria bacterium]NIX55551.1 T9SS type A sorting domain-containing protein [candidate division Zixibacteria bacterium]